MLIEAISAAFPFGHTLINLAIHHSGAFARSVIIVDKECLTSDIYSSIVGSLNRTKTKPYYWYTEGLTDRVQLPIIAEHKSRVARIYSSLRAHGADEISNMLLLR